MYSTPAPAKTCPPPSIRGFDVPIASSSHSKKVFALNSVKIVAWPQIVGSRDSRLVWGIYNSLVSGINIFCERHWAS